MSTSTAGSPTGIFVLGIGNILRGDDGAGIHVIKALERSSALQSPSPRVSLCDGGTVGLALLPSILDADGVIVVDAAELGEAPGTVRVMHGDVMDAQLGGRKRTVHEVALADLMAAAELSGGKPCKRALVAIQPESTDWSMEPTDAVGAAIPAACDRILDLIARWSDGT